MIDNRAHPAPIDGVDRVPWEPLGQIDPGKLPAQSELYPGPWTSHGRGNGHWDIVDANGRVFAHVYCWDQADYDALDAALRSSEAGHEAEIIKRLRAEYLTAHHWQRITLQTEIESRGGTAPTPEELAAAGARREATPEEIAASLARVEAMIARGTILPTRDHE